MASVNIDSVRDMSTAALRERYLAGDLTPRVLITELLEAASNDEHNIWIELLDAQRLEPYLAALESRDIAELPLYGIPFAIKDNIDLAGVDTTAACEAHRYTPDEHATAVSKLIAAGAIPLGKTNLDQFATGLVGARSPFGAGRNAFDPDYISGGSSSGSAVATALGIVSFALGTDTAGSGRVPAAFNNLIGLKPSRGLVSCKGVIPACRSLDCVSVFSLTVDDANRVLAVIEGVDEGDAYSRENRFDNGPRRYGTVDTPWRIAVPLAEQLEFFGDDAAAALFDDAVQALRDMGHEIIATDIQPLLDAAKLLYEGPWITERYVVLEDYIEQSPQDLHEVIRSLVEKGATRSAAETFSAMYELRAFQQIAERLFSSIDCLVTPTAPTVYTIAEVEADPITLNSRLGTYTNFMNLLDLCAVAVPAGFLPNGVGFGITLQAPALQDRRMLSLANSWCQQQNLTMGASGIPMPVSDVSNPAFESHVDLVVCGAHLEGMPLNWQLTERGAVRVDSTHSSANYLLYAMQDGRPAMCRDEAAGVRIEVEVWRLHKQELGSFVSDIPAPLGIGKVELDDGRWLPGFIAEPRAVIDAQDISSLGGWRAYIASR